MPPLTNPTAPITSVRFGKLRELPAILVSAMSIAQPLGYKKPLSHLQTCVGLLAPVTTAPGVFSKAAKNTDRKLQVPFDVFGAYLTQVA